MRFLTVLLVLGSVLRVLVLVFRPRAAYRFHQPRRRLLATRLEQLGDFIVIATAVTMVIWGYGHRPPFVLLALWTLMLVAGLAAVLFAHAVARNHRPGPPRAVARTAPRPLNR